MPGDVLVGSRCPALEAVFGEPAYQFVRDFSEGAGAVGAAPLPSGEVGVGGFGGVVHAPNTASEIRPNAEIINTDPERIVRKSERSDRV